MPKEKNNEKNKDKSTYLLKVILLIEFIQFVYKIFVKYNNQNLNIKYFSFLNLSTLYSFIEFFIIAIIILILFYRFSERFDKNKYIFLGFSLFSLISIIISKYYFLIYSEYLYFFIIILKYIQIGFLFSFLLSGIKKNVLRFITAFSVILIVEFSCLIYLIYNFQIFNTSNETNLKKIKYGVVFGAAVWSKNRPSPIFKERILKGLELYKSGIIQKVVVTGGKSKGEIPEALVAKNLLIKEGIPDSSIIVEDKSNSTLEQVFFIRDNLLKGNTKQTVIVISDFFHLRRISEICIFNKINVNCISSTMPKVEESKLVYILRESIGLILYWNFGA